MVYLRQILKKVIINRRSFGKLSQKTVFSLEHDDHPKRLFFNTVHYDGFICKFLGSKNVNIHYFFQV